MRKRTIILAIIILLISTKCFTQTHYDKSTIDKPKGYYLSLVFPALQYNYHDIHIKFYGYLRTQGYMGIEGDKMTGLDSTFMVSKTVSNLHHYVMFYRNNPFLEEEGKEQKITIDIGFYRWTEDMTEADREYARIYGNRIESNLIKTLETCRI